VVSLAELECQSLGVHPAQECGNGLVLAGFQKLFDESDFNQTFLGNLDEDSKMGSSDSPRFWRWGCSSSEGGFGVWQRQTYLLPPWLIV
jgi:hypothetical protein